MSGAGKSLVYGIKAGVDLIPYTHSHAITLSNELKMRAKSKKQCLYDSAALRLALKAVRGDG